MKFLIVSVLGIVLILLSSCGESYSFVGSRLVVAEKGKTKDDSILFDPVGKFYFSSLRNPATVGLFNTIEIPEENQNKELWIVVEGRARTNVPHSMASITVVGSNNEKETLCWKAAFLRVHMTDINKWCHFKDSIFLTSRLNSKIYNVVNAFVVLGTSPGERFDTDSLVVTVRQKSSII